MLRKKLHGSERHTDACQSLVGVLYMTVQNGGLVWAASTIPRVSDSSSSARVRLNITTSTHRVCSTDSKQTLRRRTHYSISSVVTFSYPAPATHEHTKNGGKPSRTASYLLSLSGNRIVHRRTVYLGGHSLHCFIPGPKMLLTYHFSRAMHTSKSSSQHL